MANSMKHRLQFGKLSCWKWKLSQINISYPKWKKKYLENVYTTPEWHRSYSHSVGQGIDDNKSMAYCKIEVP